MVWWLPVASNYINLVKKNVIEIKKYFIINLFKKIFIGNKRSKNRDIFLICIPNNQLLEVDERKLL